MHLRQEIIRLWDLIQQVLSGTGVCDAEVVVEQEFTGSVAAALVLN